MTLTLYNTRNGREEKFTPIDPRRVTMYVCGPTVYNYVHIGNARPVVVFDVLYRLLLREFPEVIYARNITDVDDKINAAARENHESIGVLTERYARAFHEDMAALNALPPSLEPRATGNIEAMIEMIGELMDNGCAYEAQGHVLFSVAAKADYGLLSHRQRRDMIAGARVEVAPFKRDPADFVLWKPSSEGQPGWDSPWGYGRPGWHTECAAMIERHLGETIDIHGGGQDLVFPHHENELAQATCAHPGSGFVRYWVHNGYITVKGEKMSKSVGNFLTVRELLRQFPGEVIRYALMSGHYRKPLDWSAELLRQARASLDRLYQALDLSQVRAEPSPEAVPEAIVRSLEDDLNTPLALAHLHELANRLNSAQHAEHATELKRGLLSAGELMGLLGQTPARWFRWSPPGGEALNETEVEALIAERETARKARDFKRADEIRDELEVRHILLEDTPQGTRWRRGGGG